MSKLIDYIKEYGHLSFKEEPYNELDAAIFSQLSIFNLDDIVESGKTMYELFHLYLGKGHKVEDPVNFLMSNRQHYLFEALSIYPRYKDLIVSDYVRVKEKENFCQFEALTIDLGDEVLISYGGTDDTIVGWHEDFLLVCNEEIGCHTLGMKYLKDIYHKFDKKINICGHSKGGNIALEITLSAPNEIFEKIAKVDCFDGPGLFMKQYPQDLIDYRISKIASYVPYHSSIGRLFHHVEPCIICDCKESFARQHDIVFWETNGKEFVIIDSRSDDSIYVENHMNSIINEMTEEERKGLVEAIFKVLYATKANNLGELVNRKFKLVLCYIFLRRKNKKYIKKFVFKKLLKDKRYKEIMKNAMEVKKLL